MSVPGRLVTAYTFVHMGWWVSEPIVLSGAARRCDLAPWPGCELNNNNGRAIPAPVANGGMINGLSHNFSALSTGPAAGPRDRPGRRAGELPEDPHGRCGLDRQHRPERAVQRGGVRARL